MDEVVTEFSMEKLMTMPKGAWREFDSPMKDRAGRMKIALTDVAPGYEHQASDYIANQSESRVTEVAGVLNELAVNVFAER